MFARGGYGIPASWVFGFIVVVWLIQTIVSIGGEMVRDMAREVYLFFQ